MQAVILAAGRGSRLGEKADGLPKCLLQVGGRPIIEHQLRALADVGAGPVLVVTGYAADLVHEAVGDRAERRFNARYDKTNSLYSLWLVREWIRGPVLILNSDVLFPREVLERLVRLGPDRLVYDSSSGRAAEHMKIRLEDGRVQDLSKTMPADQSSGENAGVIYLSEAGARKVLAKADEFVAAGRENAFWVEALREAAREIRIEGVDIAGIPWIEIDTPYDLDRARRHVWPEIMDRTGVVVMRRRRRRRAGLAAALVCLAALLAGVWWLAAAVAVRSWEPVAAQEGRRVAVSIDGVLQDWCEGQGTTPVVTRVAGPRTLRIDARCVVAPGTRRNVPYVLEVTIDGQRLDWHKFTATPDASITFADGLVCDRDKIDIAVPEGEHMVGLHLVAGEARGVLARFRILDPRP